MPASGFAPRSGAAARPPLAYAAHVEPTADAIRSISHDMRNLLTAVRGHAELALRELSSEDPAREDVAHVMVVTTAVFELIDQLDGADSAERVIATDLSATVRAMRRLLDALLPASIELHLEPDLDGTRVPLSRLRIERIVLNLVMNARDAMTDGGTLSITTGARDAGEVYLVVADSGPGFSPQALEHLFEPGFTTKRARGGSGHGLSALKHIVEAIGGSIAVDSEPAQGATITVRLPVADRDELDERHAASAASSADPARGGPGPAQQDVGTAQGAAGTARGAAGAAQGAAGAA